MQFVWLVFLTLLVYRSFLLFVFVGIYLFLLLHLFPTFKVASSKLSPKLIINLMLTNLNVRNTNRINKKKTINQIHTLIYSF